MPQVGRGLFADPGGPPSLPGCRVGVHTGECVGGMARIPASAAREGGARSPTLRLRGVSEQIREWNIVLSPFFEAGR